MKIPVHSREVVGKSMLRRVSGTFFGGSLTRAVTAYLSDPGTKLSEGVAAELRWILDEVKTAGYEPRGIDAR